jgi:hypothetical protein
VAFLIEGGSLQALAGRCASGHDGLEVTRIACAVEESLHSGRVVSL